MNKCSYVQLYKLRILRMSKKNYEACSENIIHTEIVDSVLNQMPDDDKMTDLADFFKAFGDPTRIKILYALSISEMCVCDIAALLNMTQSAISHQLRILKKSRLVKNRRDGKVIYYSLDDSHIRGIFDTGFDHLNEKQQ